MNKTNKYLLNNSKMAKYYSIFAQILFNIRFQVKYLGLEASFFLLCLLFNLSYRGLLFAMMTNLKAGPALLEFGPNQFCFILF